MDDFLNQLSGVMSAFDAGTLIGIIALVNLLTNLTKLPRVRELVPAAARKWVALGLGVVTGLLGALGDGKPLLAALLQGVIVGVGAIGTHEVTAPMVDKMRKVPPATVVTMVFITSLGGGTLFMASCTWWKSGGGDEVKGAVSKCARPEIKDTITAFIPVALALVDKLTDEDGAVDWDSFADSSKQSGWDGAVCLFDEAVKRFLIVKPKAGPNQRPHMDLDLQKERALEARSKTWPGM